MNREEVVIRAANEIAMCCDESLRCSQCKSQGTCYMLLLRILRKQKKYKNEQEDNK